MISPHDIRDLDNRSDEDLRQIIALASGMVAHRNGDGGMLMATVLRRVADRLENRPRHEAAA